MAAKTTSIDLTILAGDTESSSARYPVGYEIAALARLADDGTPVDIKIQGAYDSDNTFLTLTTLANTTALNTVAYVTPSIPLNFSKIRAAIAAAETADTKVRVFFVQK
jgi:hypothetical protein